jgi:alanyl-tRNA synthetase
VKEWVDNDKKSVKTLSGKDVFLLYQSYGFPIEMIEEEIKNFRKGLPLKIDKKGFQEELAKHQELSRTAAQGRFKSGLADNSEQTTKLHTTAHLLLSALRIVLKDKGIIQRGSNITPERLRLDFSFNRALTNEEIKKTEDLINKEIDKNQVVIREEMSPSEAKKKGASGIFDSKYGERVSVYTIGNFSKEICAGPHMKNTKEIGHFKIIKEESSSSGVRRIKAIVS